MTTRVLIPLSIIGGMLLIWQGLPQNFDPNVTVTTIEGTQQDIAMGPVAALEIIKHIGTNGGGFLGANSSTPIENPTIISDLVELYSMMILPGACVIMFGKMVKDRRRKTASSSEHSATTQDLVKTSELVSKPSFTAKLYCPVRHVHHHYHLFYYWHGQQHA